MIKWNSASPVGGFGGPQYRLYSCIVRVIAFYLLKINVTSPNLYHHNVERDYNPLNFKKIFFICNQYDIIQPAQTSVHIALNQLSIYQLIIIRFIENQTHMQPTPTPINA